MHDLPEMMIKTHISKEKQIKLVGLTECQFMKLSENNLDKNLLCSH